MPAYAYRDYLNHLFDESARTQQIAQQVLGNCEGLLNMFSEFIKGRFTETSNIVESHIWESRKCKAGDTRGCLFGLPHLRMYC